MNFLYRNAVKITLDGSINDCHLASHTNGSISALLQYLNDSLTESKAGLCIRIKVTSELGKGLKLSVL